MKKELLIGCGHSREKKIYIKGDKEWGDLTTLDNNILCNPDITCDLNYNILPFLDDTFDEIHAYEVLEHLGGGQGDYMSFFAMFSEFWRVLKNGGKVCCITPSLSSPWLWGDPGHRRAICSESLIFLYQPAYTEQAGKTPMSDYRNVYEADFDIAERVTEKYNFNFVLVAVKPSRIKVV